MMVSVVKVWKVGATISALVSFAALIVHLQYSSQPTRSKSLEVPATEAGILEALMRGGLIHRATASAVSRVFTLL
jgi:hypothetical protein